jgi:hypothetical protein
MLRYQKLNKFPQDRVEELKKIYHKNIPDPSTYPDNMKSHSYQWQRTGIKVLQEKFDLGPEFQSIAFFMLSKPNGQMGHIHLDPTLQFTLNIPIYVHATKGQFLAPKYDSLDYYPKPYQIYSPRKDDPTYKGPKYWDVWDYNKDLFEYVDMDSPILINNWLPHSWMNYHSEWRVVCSIFFKTKDITEAQEIVRKWQ